MIDVAAVCKRAKEASYALAGYSADDKNRMLNAVALALGDARNRERMKRENAVDVENAKTTGRDATFIDRLTLTDARIDDMIEGVRQIVALPDPVGEVVEHRTLDNGLDIKRVRAPLGVIGIIYEARPNVTVDAAALCLKSGNAVVLRGGKDAINSNRALYEIMHGAIAAEGLNADAVAFIDDPSREASKIMLAQDAYIDVLIPRGGEGLKKFVLDNAAMPVIASAGGNCHIYVEKTADTDKAVPVIVNAKVQRPSTCNALEHLLVDREMASEFLPAIYAALREKNVEILGTDEVRAILPDVAPATEHCHSEAILTRDKAAADYFTANVDSAAVYVNASTRFTDGFQFGLGAEMGISTQKLHARGPIALKELTSVKYVITGDGQVRK